MRERLQAAQAQMEKVMQDPASRALYEQTAAVMSNQEIQRRMAKLKACFLTLLEYPRPPIAFSAVVELMCRLRCGSGWVLDAISLISSFSPLPSPPLT